MASVSPLHTATNGQFRPTKRRPKQHARKTRAKSNLDRAPPVAPIFTDPHLVHVDPLQAKDALYEANVGGPCGAPSKAAWPPN